MNDELLDKMKRAANVIASIKETILAMCDDMDRTDDIKRKEAIKIAIIKTEKLLDSSIEAYNELVKQAAEHGWDR